MSKQLFKTLSKTPALRRSFNENPLGSLDVLEKKFNLKFDNIKPADVEVLASLSDEEFKLLEKLQGKFESMGDLAANGDTGNLYY